MPQPAVQDPLWHTWPLGHVVVLASFTLLQSVVLTAGLQPWQGLEGFSASLA